MRDVCVSWWIDRVFESIDLADGFLALPVLRLFHPYCPLVRRFLAYRLGHTL